MNCLLLEPDEVDASSDRAIVRGRRRRHAEEILRATPGDVLRIGIVGGRLGRGRILSLDDTALSLALELESDPPPKLDLTLVLALPRPPVFRRLLATVASLGIPRIRIASTARTEKSFWQSHDVEPEAIRARLLLGLEQARDSVLPEVSLHRYFEPLVEEVLAPELRTRRGWLPHPSATTPCPHASEEPATVFVGPEGGFVDYEVERLSSAGFEPVSLGPRVLRVEPVIPMLVGRLAPGPARGPGSVGA